MKISLKALMPKFEFAVCAYCGELFGYTEDEVEVLEGKSSTQTIPTLTCPICNKLLILPTPQEESVESIEISTDCDCNFDLLYDDEGDDFGYV